MRSPILLLIPLLLLTCCHPKQSRTRFTDIDKDLAWQPVHINRLDADFLRSEPDAATLARLYELYPEFTPHWVDMVLNVSPADTLRAAEQAASLRDFMRQVGVDSAVTSTFADVSPIEEQIGRAFARLRTFYPEAAAPEVYFFVSGFQQSILFDDSLTAISTDMYLGADYPLYQDLASVYNYQLYDMRPQCIPIDVVSAWLFSHFPFQADASRLLDHMIYRGRIIYLLSVIMPDVAENDIMGYTPQQWAWCIKNEKNIWGTLLDNRDLFTTSQQTIGKYLNQAPRTEPISYQSPGRLGTWLGWRIINSYMEAHPEVTMQQLLLTTNSQHLLEQSEYHP